MGTMTEGVAHIGFHYQALRLMVSQGGAIARQSSVHPSSSDGDVLQGQVAQMGEYFREHLLELPHEGLEPGQWGMVQSLHTEVHRQIRLVATDVGFWRAARRTETVQQRLGQVGDRLETLRQYCDGMLKIVGTVGTVGIVEPSPESNVPWKCGGSGGEE